MPMEAIELLAANTKDFSTDGGADGDGIIVRWKGSADLRAQEPLTLMLRSLHEEARRRGTRAVRVDLTELEFMNSSCFKNVLFWINQVQQLAPEEQYRIRFLSNPTLHWQKRSLRALQTFAAELVTVEG
jgi:hypothetical protein